MRGLQFSSVLLAALVTSACKIEITVPSAGDIETESGQYVCASGKNCTIDVVDFDFDETFVAKPKKGYLFDGWKNEAKHFCAGKLKTCRLSTAGFRGNEALENILRSDEVFFLAPTFIPIPVKTALTLTPEGGDFELPEGVKLSVPRGAVANTTNITLSRLPVKQTDLSVGIHGKSSSIKRFLAGIAVEPDIEFRVPVKVTLPLEDLGPYELPVQIEIDTDRSRYWYEKTDLTYLPEKRAVEIKVNHFSKVGVGAIDGVEMQLLDDLCTDPRFNGLLSVCEDFDELQPAYCLLRPGDRPENASCCRELSFSSQSEALDFLSNRASGNCEMVADDLRITFHECTLPGGGSAPTETYEACQISPNCSQAERQRFKYTLEIKRPDVSCFAKGETMRLRTVVRDSRGEVQEHVAVTWRSLNPRVAEVGKNGVVRALRGGQARIEASYRRACQVFSDVVKVDIMDISGAWTAKEVADETSCGEGINTYRSAVRITKSGDTVSIKGSNGSASATKRGCSLSGYSFEYEDEGVTRGSGSATIAGSGKTISGSGSWTWSDGADSCSGTSKLTFTR